MSASTSTFRRRARLSLAPGLACRRTLVRRGHSDAGAAAALSGPAFQRDQARRVWRDGCAPLPLDASTGLPEHSMERLTLGDRCMVAACREERKASRHDAAVRAFVTKPLRGIFCGLARDLPPASGEGITSHNSMQHIAPQRSAGNRPCRRPPLAESGRIRRRCMVHLLCDVIASRSRDRPQSCCSFRAGARVIYS